MTDTPVKTQFGYHIIQLEDVREAQFPAFDDVKPQIEQRLAQVKLQKYQEDLRKAAKTDYKFSQHAVTALPRRRVQAADAKLAPRSRAEAKPPLGRFGGRSASRPRCAAGDRSAPRSPRRASPARSVVPASRLSSNISSITRLAGGEVEAAGGLVGEQHRGPHDEGARQRHALLLAARQHARVVLQPLAQAHARQHLGGARARVGARPAAPAAASRSRARVRLRQQLEALEHEAELSRAHCGARVLVEREEIAAAPGAPCPRSACPARPRCPAACSCPSPTRRRSRPTRARCSAKAMSWRIVSVPVESRTCLVTRSTAMMGSDMHRSCRGRGATRRGCCTLALGARARCSRGWRCGPRRRARCAAMASARCWWWATACRPNTAWRAAAAGWRCSSSACAQSKSAPRWSTPASAATPRRAAARDCRRCCVSTSRRIVDHRAGQQRRVARPAAGDDARQPRRDGARGARRRRAGVVGRHAACRRTTGAATREEFETMFARRWPRPKAPRWCHSCCAGIADSPNAARLVPGRPHPPERQGAADHLRQRLAGAARPVALAVASEREPRMRRCHSRTRARLGCAGAHSAQRSRLAAACSTRCALCRWLPHDVAPASQPPAPRWHRTRLLLRGGSARLRRLHAAGPTSVRATARPPGSPGSARLGAVGAGGCAAGAGGCAQAVRAGRRRHGALRWAPAPACWAAPARRRAAALAARRPLAAPLCRLAARSSPATMARPPAARRCGGGGTARGPRSRAVDGGGGRGPAAPSRPASAGRWPLLPGGAG